MAWGDESLAALVAGVEGLAAEDRSGWSGAARSARVIEIGRAVERLQAELVRAVGAWDAASDWAVEGALGPAPWLAHRLPLTRPAAARLVRTARLARKHDRVGKALAAGDVSVAHVEEMARVARKREDVFAECEDMFVDAAQQVAPAKFPIVADRWREIADDLVGTIDTPGDDVRDELHVSRTLGGVRLDGWLHTAAGLELMARLDAVDRPDPVDGDRPPRSCSQRRAAALMALVCGETVAPKAIDATIDVETLDGRMPSDLLRARCDVEGFGPVAPSLIRSWIADAVLRRVITAGSEVLDLGRGVRFATPAQRRALRHRDDGCVVPGCDRLARWSDAHHRVEDHRGGPTDLDNLGFVCRRHHTMLDAGWVLEHSADGAWRFDPPADPSERAPP